MINAAIEQLEILLFLSKQGKGVHKDQIIQEIQKKVGEARDVTFTIRAHISKLSMKGLVLKEDGLIYSISEEGELTLSSALAWFDCMRQELRSVTKKAS